MSKFDRKSPATSPILTASTASLSDEWLNQQCLLDIKYARIQIESGRMFYNEERPHSSLKGLSPGEFVK
ncbi:MAG: integrase core domain-containing protein [Candidatus Hodarchaeota archaeon]